MYSNDNPEYNQTLRVGLQVTFISPFAPHLNGVFVYYSVLYTNIDQKLVNSLHGLLNC